MKSSKHRVNAKCWCNSGIKYKKCHGLFKKEIVQKIVYEAPPDDTKFQCCDEIIPIGVKLDLSHNYERYTDYGMGNSFGLRPFK